MVFSKSKAKRPNSVMIAISHDIRRGLAKATVLDFVFLFRSCSVPCPNHIWVLFPFVHISGDCKQYGCMVYLVIPHSHRLTLGPYPNLSLPF